jgi:hypothetical protein
VLFYTNDGLLASGNHEWLQMALSHLCELFERMGLRMNVQKTKSMTCHSVSSIQYQPYTPGYTTASLSQMPTKNNDSVTLQKCSYDYNCRLS